MDLYYYTDDEDFNELVNHTVHRRPKNFRQRCNHFEKWNDTEFLQRYRLSKETVCHLIENLPLEFRPMTVSPGGEEAEIYRNRKGYFSFNVQAICDSKLIIKDIVDDQVRHQMLQFLIIQGCEEIWNFKGSLLLGDAGYPIKNYLMTPLQDPRTPAEALYNEAQIRTRNPIERCFGVWKWRFPILALGIKLHIDKVEEIVIASAVIHNVAIHMRDELSYVNEEIEAAIQIGNVNEVANQLKNCYLKIYCKVQ